MGTIHGMTLITNGPYESGEHRAKTLKMGCTCTLRKRFVGIDLNVGHIAMFYHELRMLIRFKTLEKFLRAFPQDPKHRNPTSKTRRADLLQWMEEKGIVVKGVTTGKTVKELYKIACTYKTEAALEFENLLKGTPHIVVWLPPYFPLYNAIELVSRHFNAEYDL